jgi:protein-tyrosine phosphatase
MEINESAVVPAAPDAVWAVGGDVGNIADWIPAIEASHMEGDVRHATFADGGGDAQERIVSRDDANRSYVYEYLSGPLPLQQYVSTFSVHEHAQGSEVRWHSDFTTGDPAQDPGVAEAIAGIYRGALAELTAKFTT